VISIVTKWWIIPGNEDQAIPALRELARDVERHEPFTTMYLINTPVVAGSLPAPPDNEVVFLGTWDDRAAFDQHLNGPLMAGWLARYLDLFLTSNGGGLYVAAELIERQAGFIRSASTGS
jgi:quinol monooxygenase YgiN